MEFAIECPGIGPMNGKLSQQHLHIKAHITAGTASLHVFCGGSCAALYSSTALGLDFACKQNFPQLSEATASDHPYRRRGCNLPLDGGVTEKAQSGISNQEEQ